MNVFVIKEAAKQMQHAQTGEEIYLIVSQASLYKNYIWKYCGLESNKCAIC